METETIEVVSRKDLVRFDDLNLKYEGLRLGREDKNNDAEVKELRRRISAAKKNFRKNKLSRVRVYLELLDDVNKLTQILSGQIDCWFADSEHEYKILYKDVSALIAKKFSCEESGGSFLELLNRGINL